MEGTRAPLNGQPAIDVHVYELYWADLSRLKAGMFSIFTELYQLLFHLPSLGVHTVNAATLHHPTRDWRIFRQLQAVTAGVLTVPIPIFNLLMFGMVVMVVASNSLKNATTALVLSASGLGVVLIVGLGWLLWRLLAKKNLNPWIWLSPLVLVAGAIYGVATRVPSQKEPWNYALQIVASFVVAVIVGLLLLLILAVYDRRRPGAMKWAGTLALAILVAGVGSLFWRPPDPGHQSVVAFWVRLFELCDISLLFFWGSFFLLGMGTWVIGGIAVFSSRKTDKLARRSRWTGLLMLSLPALAFLIVTVALWHVIATSMARFLPHTSYVPLWCRLFPVNTVDAIIGVVRPRLGIALETLLLAAGISLLPAIWSLAPVVWTEVFPVKSTPRSRGDESLRLGRWQTLTFHGLFVSGFILYIATMIFLPLRFSLSVFFKGWEPFAAAVVSGTGLLSLFLVRGRLKKLALGFRPVLDILLDVDNWFREHPLDSNPKARICGRYVSLLRYLCKWRKDSADANSGYDGIVVIAHSQGTVITADLLRFLKKESQGNLRSYDPELQSLGPSQGSSDSRKIPIYFFTMGSPLRQLYGLRFPHLYHWARHADESTMTCWNKSDIPKGQLPDPSELLGVTLWVNCYRSGDYVGRSLWRTDRCAYMWTGDCHAGLPASAIKSSSTDGVKRLEFCIGAGAHTHYWDRYARIVATELDLLIAAL